MYARLSLWIISSGIAPCLVRQCPCRTSYLPFENLLKLSFTSKESGTAVRFVRYPKITSFSLSYNIFESANAVFHTVPISTYTNEQTIVRVGYSLCRIVTSFRRHSRRWINRPRSWTNAVRLVVPLAIVRRPPQASGIPVALANSPFVRCRMYSWNFGVGQSNPADFIMAFR